METLMTLPRIGRISFQDSMGIPSPSMEQSLMQPRPASPPRCKTQTTAMAFIHAICITLFLSSLMPMTTTQSAGGDLQTYIVHLAPPDGQDSSKSENLESWYHTFLLTNTTASEKQQRILYCYRNVMTGFAVRLTTDEVTAMQDKPGFVAAHPEQIYRLQTTHSPQFLGLPLREGSFNGSALGKGIIIAVMDTGVMPDHPSFSGDGMPPPPAKWKGRCDFNPSQCNNKLIGARSFHGLANVTMPPADYLGHGTHTASTAAGASVQANTLRMAEGTAHGMAPYAHLAIYNVCPTEFCFTSDILAGVDAAITDGVDVISMSFGGFYAPPFYMDDVAVATFAATQRGIFVSCSAGNSGPSPGSVLSVAPWMLTVGASTIDRNFVATVKLGNGAEYKGETVYQPSFSLTLLPLVYPDSRSCGHLKISQVKGKIVLCEEGLVSSFEKAKEVKRAGGAAMILINKQIDGFSLLAEVYGLPASHVSYSAGEEIKAYINGTKSPTATIVFKGTVFGNPTAPAVASFSSRGPSSVSPGILKPDIVGPGLNILAAWPFPVGNDTKAKYYFNIISGTSMSCPHLSGIAAIIKAIHPDWSPAAIKSAIMTSAKQLNINRKPILDERLQPADVFAIGAGQVDPVKAIDPGLVYDIQPDDYIPYLCGLGYTNEQVSRIAHKLVNCSGVPSIPEGELNYPSFFIILGSPQIFTRTVTNVGTDYSPYVVTVVPPPGVYVSVKPDKLNFSKLNQKATYFITLNHANSAHVVTNFSQGYLRWDSKKYSVRSPIVIQFI